MRSHKKRYRKKLNTKRRQHGGLLVMNPSDLQNSHMCDIRKESIADEMYTYNGNIFALTPQTVGFLLQQFRQIENHWFKFVIFNNDGIYHIALINGGQINKHSVCMLIGLLDVTLDKGEYMEIREAVKRLHHFKMNHEPEKVFSTPRLRDELEDMKVQLNELVLRDMRCMPVVCAGSGTVMPDQSICINNKSGHYKPKQANMEIAKQVFEENTGLSVFISEKPDKAVLKQLYGDEYENYTGICLPTQSTP